MSAFESGRRRRVPVREAVHGDRQHEERDGERRRAAPGPLVASAPAPREHDRDGDAGEAARRARSTRRSTGPPWPSAARSRRDTRAAARSRPRARPAARASRSARASTAAPPASANANGTKPAARRDCDSETRSEKCGKTNGRSSSASTSTMPPSTSALQRRRAASAASGDEHERGDRDRARARDEARARGGSSCCECTTRSLAYCLSRLRTLGRARVVRAASRRRSA